MDRFLAQAGGLAHWSALEFPVWWMSSCQSLIGRIRLSSASRWSSWRDPGGPPAELSRGFEPSSQTIRNWVRQADRDEGWGADGVTSAEPDELRRLRRENKRLPRSGRFCQGRHLVRSGGRFEVVEVSDS